LFFFSKSCIARASLRGDRCFSTSRPNDSEVPRFVRGTHNTSHRLERCCHYFVLSKLPFATSRYIARLNPYGANSGASERNPALTHSAPSCCIPCITCATDEGAPPKVLRFRSFQVSHETSSTKESNPFLNPDDISLLDASHQFTKSASPFAIQHRRTQPFGAVDAIALW